MNKRKILIAAAGISAALIMAVGMTSSYLTDVEVKDNIITIGKVSITLDEGGFDTSSVYDVVPGSRVTKAPKITKNGNKDEFVFMKITVPKKTVTLLNESGTDKGKPKTGLTGTQQLFRLTADGTPETVPASAGKDIEFEYHAGTTTDKDNGTYGWMLLESDLTSDTADTYVFGYNKRMAPNNETVTLFDSVQLKSFIDGETKGTTDIGVVCYGIQADNLKPSGTAALNDTYIIETTLQAVYTIVKNKASA